MGCDGCNREASDFAAQAAVMSGDPLARKLLEADAGGMGRIVWPGEVNQEKSRIGGVAAGVDEMMHRCYQAGSPELTAWQGLYQAWRAFEATPAPWIGSGGEFDLAEQYERQIEAYAAQARARGCGGAPAVIPRGDVDAQAGESVLSAVKLAAGAAIVVALVYGVTRVI